MIPDPALLESIPAEVHAAARLLDSYFRQQNTEEWALHGVCSRLMYERLKARADAANDRLAFNSPWAFKCV
jgi:hypothetical protein